MHGMRSLCVLCVIVFASFAVKIWGSGYESAVIRQISVVRVPKPNAGTCSRHVAGHVNRVAEYKLLYYICA